MRNIILACLVVLLFLLMLYAAFWVAGYAASLGYR
jgi:hypothetical protein